MKEAGSQQHSGMKRTYLPVTHRGEENKAGGVLPLVGSGKTTGLHQNPGNVASRMINISDLLQASDCDSQEVTI